MCDFTIKETVVNGIELILPRRDAIGNTEGERSIQSFVQNAAGILVFFDQ
jgi:hypothetical protein